MKIKLQKKKKKKKKKRQRNGESFTRRICGPLFTPEEESLNTNRIRVHHVNTSYPQEKKRQWRQDSQKSLQENRIPARFSTGRYHRHHSHQNYPIPWFICPALNLTFTLPLPHFSPKLFRRKIGEKTLETIGLQWARSASPDKHKHSQTPTPIVETKSEASKDFQGLALCSPGDVTPKHDFQVWKALRALVNFQKINKDMIWYDMINLRNFRSAPHGDHLRQNGWQPHTWPILMWGWRSWSTRP